VRDDGELDPASFRRVLAVICGTVLVFGATYGLLASDLGLTPLEAIAMSAFVMNGGAQFAALGAVGAGAGLIAASLAGLALSLRFLPLGATAGPYLSGGPTRRLTQAYLLTDQGIALGHRHDGGIDEGRYLAAGFGVFLTWMVGTVIGVWGRDLVGDPAEWGLDAAYPALFLVLIAPRIRTDPRARRAAVAGGVLAIATYPLLPAGIPVALAALGAIAGFAGAGSLAPPETDEPTDVL
jgi:predicted branched-subunit amino acid permease